MITLAEPLELDALRIRHEFLSLPDLRVSVDDVARMLGVSRHHAQQLLDHLAAESFLTTTPDRRYVRVIAAAS